MPLTTAGREATRSHRVHRRIPEYLSALDEHGNVVAAQAVRAFVRVAARYIVEAARSRGVVGVTDTLKDAMALTEAFVIAASGFAADGDGYHRHEVTAFAMYQTEGQMIVACYEAKTRRSVYEWTPNGLPFSPVLA